MGRQTGHRGAMWPNHLGAFEMAAFVDLAERAGATLEVLVSAGIGGLGARQ